MHLEDPAGFCHPPQVKIDTSLKLLVLLVMITGVPSCVDEIQEILPAEVRMIPLKTSPLGAVEIVVITGWLRVIGVLNGTVVVGKMDVDIDDEIALEEVLTLGELGVEVEDEAILVEVFTIDVMGMKVEEEDGVRSALCITMVFEVIFKSKVGNCVIQEAM